MAVLTLSEASFLRYFLFIWNLEIKYNAKAMSTYRHHSTYKSGIW